MTDTMTIDEVAVQVNYAHSDDAPITDAEALAYVQRAHEKYPHGKLETLILDVDGDEVGIHYGLAPVKFDRIRRITGYLVGTLDRFNDAKRAEEHDRVKHTVGSTTPQA